MNLRELIREARKHLSDPEETLDFGPRGRKAAQGAAPENYKPPVVACSPGTVRQRKTDGSSACVALRGGKAY